MPNNLRLRRSVFVLSPILLATASATAGGGGYVFNPQNGSYYLAVPTATTINWTDAFAAAGSMFYQGRTGHLATITSQNEMDFFLSHLPELGDAMNEDYWIGGRRLGSDPDPNVGWTWITGEAWSYTNWDEGEPNGLAGGTEDYLKFWTGHGILGKWNDDINDAPTPGYVVEFSIPSPSTGVAFAAVAAVATSRRRRR
ncbi:MAG: hypothetical protein KF745_13400 [Phycisphaeraceae bacterium]|nr:hypothetical protein [Phycisphaeraceae bacterium]